FEVNGDLSRQGIECTNPYSKQSQADCGWSLRWTSEPIPHPIARVKARRRYEASQYSCWCDRNDRYGIVVDVRVRRAAAGAGGFRSRRAANPSTAVLQLPRSFPTNERIP